MKIYIVMGTTGEYSDRSEWPVKAFYCEKVAQDLVVAATRKAKELEVIRNSVSRYDAPKRGSNEFDPNMQMDYTGIDYYIMETELQE